MIIEENSSILKEYENKRGENKETQDMFDIFINMTNTVQGKINPTNWKEATVELNKIFEKLPQAIETKKELEE